MRRRCGLALAAALAACTPAAAGTITFSGTVASSPFSGITAGEPVTGTFDPTDPTDYLFSVGGANLIGGAISLTIEDGPVDRLTLVEVEGPFRFTLELIDPTATAFTLGQPTTLSIGLFASAGGTYADVPGGQTLTFALDSISGTIPAVPEPASLALLGCGAVAVGGLTARRRPRTRPRAA